MAMGITNNSASGKDQVLSPCQIKALIADGQSIIIVDQKVLRVDAWLPYHPGGHKPIQHFIGKDATDEFMVYVIALVRALCNATLR